MNSRIRYENSEVEGILQSKNVVTSSKTGARYRIYINIEVKTYIIKNVNTSVCYEGGENVNNMNVLKRNIKSRLSKMGVEFISEKRNRCFGLCPKGMTQEIWEKEKGLV